LVSTIIFGQTLFIINFESDTPGEFPKGWNSKQEDEMAEVYSVEKEENNRFLHADAGGKSITIGYDREWELAEYPILSWKWRAIKLPEATGEHEKSGNDDVLGVYVVFGGWPVPKTIKYIWSETLPVGTKLPSPFSGRTKMVVIESGDSLVGQWVTEERDVLADYRRLFDDPDAAPTARGVAVLTDSDNTATDAIGDYDDITVGK